MIDQCFCQTVAAAAQLPIYNVTYGNIKLLALVLKKTILL